MNPETMLPNLKAQLEFEEGRRAESYPDTRGLWTIGIGHHDASIGPGMAWTEDQIDETFARDVAEKLHGILQSLPWVALLDDARAAVLVEAAFQMGVEDLLTFHTFLGLVRDQRWSQAAGDMLGTAWAQQTPARVRRLARQIETGEWQVVAGALA